MHFKHAMNRMRFVLRCNKIAYNVYKIATSCSLNLTNVSPLHCGFISSRFIMRCNKFSEFAEAKIGANFSQLGRSNGTILMRL